ncbi:MAG: MFS transporter [Bacteroidales bacterium]|nr:MFS transporter [Bacteroidales bacterium]
MKKAFAALAFGTFGLGISEFVMMGILPYLSADFHISIAEAGHFISAYAIGVCVGAPLVAVFCRRMPLRRILVMLTGVMVLAALALSLCPAPEEGSDARWTYGLMMLFRFVAGLPHGAYFGVSSIVCERLAKADKAASSIAIVSFGMAVANLVGIPLGTFLAEVMSWRVVFGLASLWDLMTLIAVWRWLPWMEPMPDNGVKAEFRFLKSLAPWLIILATIMGNGGVFCWYSYVSPTMTQLAGVPAAWLGGIMVLAGAGMVLGNQIGGRLADRYGAGRTGRALDAGICVALLAISWLAHDIRYSLPLLFITTACLFAVSSPQQLLILRFSRGGELMGGALVQIAFNFGNAVGAWLGGLPIDQSNPETYRQPALFGAFMAAVGVWSYAYFCRRYGSRERLS